jgi:hypothetical protein
MCLRLGSVGLGRLLGCHSHDIQRDTNTTGLSGFSFECVHKHHVIADHQGITYQLKLRPVELYLAISRES